MNSRAKNAYHTVAMIFKLKLLFRNRRLNSEIWDFRRLQMPINLELWTSISQPWLRFKTPPNGSTYNNYSTFEIRNMATLFFFSYLREKSLNKGRSPPLKRGRAFMGSLHSRTIIYTLSIYWKLFEMVWETQIQQTFAFSWPYHQWKVSLAVTFTSTSVYTRWIIFVQRARCYFYNEAQLLWSKNSKHACALEWRTWIIYVAPGLRSIWFTFRNMK